MGRIYVLSAYPLEQLRIENLVSAVDVTRFRSWFPRSYCSLPGLKSQEQTRAQKGLCVSCFENRNENRVSRPAGQHDSTLGKVVTPKL
jgi:hypothetical protein